MVQCSMECKMTELSLRSVRPVPPKEIASISARFLTGIVIGFAGVLCLLPFLVYFTG
jgi:hypothetical protein